MLSLSRQNACNYVAHVAAFGLPAIAPLQGVSAEALHPAQHQQAHSGAIGTPVLEAVRYPVLAASCEVVE